MRAYVSSAINILDHGCLCTNHHFYVVLENNTYHLGHVKPIYVDDDTCESVSS